MPTLRKFQSASPAGPEPSQRSAIEDYASSKGLRVVEVIESGNHWFYWLRGKLLLSNIARIFVVDVEAIDGSRHRIHVAFEPWGNKPMQVLLEQRAL